MQQKEFWKSKVFWVNLIAVILFIVQLFVKNFIIPLEIQGSILALINFILRWVTKEEIVWRKK